MLCKSLTPPTPITLVIATWISTRNCDHTPIARLLHRNESRQSIPAEIRIALQGLPSRQECAGGLLSPHSSTLRRSQGRGSNHTQDCRARLPVAEVWPRVHPSSRTNIRGRVSNTIGEELGPQGRELGLQTGACGHGLRRSPPPANCRRVNDILEMNIPLANGEGEAITRTGQPIHSPSVSSLPHKCVFLGRRDSMGNAVEKRGFTG